MYTMGLCPTRRCELLSGGCHPCALHSVSATQVTVMTLKCQSGRFQSFPPSQTQTWSGWLCRYWPHDFPIPSWKWPPHDTTTKFVNLACHSACRLDFRSHPRTQLSKISKISKGHNMMPLKAGGYKIGVSPIRNTDSLMSASDIQI